MQPIKPKHAEFEKVVTIGEQSFYWHHVICKQFSAPYHYHPECELIHIRQGFGRRLIGASIREFGPGDLVFIAPNVPHIWQVAPECPKAEVLYIQFLPDFLGTEFFHSPEMRAAFELLSNAHGGVSFGASTRKKISASLSQFPTHNPTARLLALLDILCRLGQDAAITPVGRSANPVHLSRHIEERVSKVFKYLNENLSEPITQADVACKVRLSSSAFSRLFKRTTGKCFMQVVNELRIAQVCRLLVESDRSISEIAFGCGFESLSNFHSQFRVIMQTSPGAYRRKLEAIAAGEHDAE